jgi:peptidoglycan/LPS O-acetylase OafA/YrhL
MDRRNNFDAIRLLAALTVMVSHAFALSGRPEPRPYAGLTLGTFAVFVFFAISGYLVSASWRSDPDIRRFLARRMLRIAPAYIIVIAVTEAFLRMTGIPEFTMNPLSASNGSLWTIPVEVECYLLFMLLAATVRHGAIAMVLLVLYLGTEGLFKQFAGFFALAALISEYPILGRRLATLAFVAAGLLMIFLSHVYYGVVLILVPLVIVAGNASWPVLREAGRHGDFSYGVYLYAFPVQQIAIMLLGPQQPYLLLFGITLSATSFFAWCSWRYVEYPALGLKRGLDKFRPARAVSEPALTQAQLTPAP